MLETVNRFFKSLDFLKGIVMAIAMLIPIFFSKYFLNDIHIGFSIALGVLFCGFPLTTTSSSINFFGFSVSLSIVNSVSKLFNAV